VELPLKIGPMVKARVVMIPLAMAVKIFLTQQARNETVRCD
jgi:hypothetical protein